MGNGWGNLIKIPFFGFLPNFFLGVGFLYVLEWSGVIKNWSQLFAPIYSMGSAGIIPSWLVALFILVVVFGLGWGVSSVGEFVTTWPFQIESIEEYIKHAYFYDYSQRPSEDQLREGTFVYPTTIKYTPFRKEAIDRGILWHVFREENPAAEVAERDFAINAPIYSGLFVLSLLYFGIELSHQIIQGYKEQWLLTVLISLLTLSIIIAASSCGRKKDLLNSLEVIYGFDMSWGKRQLYHIMECRELTCLILVLGIIWLGLLGANGESKFEPPIRLTLVLLLALMFYVNSIRSKINANALDYTHYWKLREEELKERKNQKSESPEDVQR